MTATAAARTTLADLMAAAALGAIDPATTTVVTAEQAAEEARAAAAAAQDATAAAAAAAAAAPAPIDPSVHVCNASGCRHGAHTTGQPDRQLKLAAPCGAIARMTARALARAGGEIRCAHGDPFAIAATRQYTRAAK